MAFSNAEKQARYRAKRVFVLKKDLCSICRVELAGRRRRRQRARGTQL